MTYTDVGIRMAHKFSDKFAAKVNFGYLKGTDWFATNYDDKDRFLVEHVSLTLIMMV